MATVESILSLYERVLTQRLGFTVERVDDAIGVEVAGLHALVEAYDNDPEYFQMVIPMSGPDEPFDDVLLARICLNATRDIKVAKATLDEDGMLIFAIEMITASPDTMPTEDHLAEILPRSIALLLGIVRRVTQDIEFHSITADMEEPE